MAEVRFDAPVEGRQAKQFEAELREEHARQKVAPPFSELPP